VFDENVGEWKYQYGYKRKNDDKFNWVMDDRPELLKEAGVEDPFMLNKKLRKEMVDKQNKRERANKLRVVNKQDKAMVPGVIGISNKGRHEYKDIERALSFAQKSTGSLGFYDQKMTDEPKNKKKTKSIPSDW